MKDPVILWIMMGIFIWKKKKIYHKNYLDVGEHSPTRMGLLSCRRIIPVNFWFIFGQLASVVNSPFSYMTFLLIAISLKLTLIQLLLTNLQLKI